MVTWELVGPLGGSRSSLDARAPTDKVGSQTPVQIPLVNRLYITSTPTNSAWTERLWSWFPEVQVTRVLSTELKLIR